MTETSTNTSPSRAASRSREPVTCHHPGSPHRHGTERAYQEDKCGCDACRAAHTRHVKEHRLARMEGRRLRTVDAEPVRRHLSALRDAGMTWSRVEELSGISRVTLRNLVNGKPGTDGQPVPNVRVSHRVARNVLNVPIPRSGDVLVGVVNAAGTRRRLRALLAAGHTVPTVAATSGCHRSTLDRVLHGAERVHATTRARVARAYDILCASTPATATRWDRMAVTRARQRAQQGGWQPPAMWDESIIDDPDAPEPRPGRVGGRFIIDLDEWAWLVSNGVCTADASHRVGSTVRQVRDSARRRGRRDVTDLLDRAVTVHRVGVARTHDVRRA